MEHSNDEKRIFGDNIRLLRKVRRLSQKELAQIMGVSIYCVRKAEQAIITNSLCVDALINLSRHFHLRPSTPFSPITTLSVLTKGEFDAT